MRRRTSWCKAPALAAVAVLALSCWGGGDRVSARSEVAGQFDTPARVNAPASALDVVAPDAPGRLVQSPLHELQATHGFVTFVALHSGDAVARVRDLSAVIDLALARSATPGDPFHGRLDAERIGIAGVSVGRRRHRRRVGRARNCRRPADQGDGPLRAGAGDYALGRQHHLVPVLDHGRHAVQRCRNHSGVRGRDGLCIARIHVKSQTPSTGTTTRRSVHSPRRLGKQR